VKEGLAGAVYDLENGSLYDQPFWHWLWSRGGNFTRPEVAMEAGVSEMFSPDEDLESVFRYLVAR